MDNMTASFFRTTNQGDVLLAGTNQRTNKQRLAAVRTTRIKAGKLKEITEQGIAAS
jgi:hypothetical protein